MTVVVMSPEEAAWQAGIVDGEGCLTIARQIRKNRPSPAFRVTIQVANTNVDLLDPFVQAWGGNLYNHKEFRNEWADAYTWHCPDAKAKLFLETMLPYLRGKDKQAKLLLAFIADKKKFNRHPIGKGKGSAPLGAEEIAWRESVWKKVRSLNSKGQYARSLSKEVTHAT